MKIKYMLRRTLCPWNAKEIADETVAYCRKSRVDEIAWITESSGMYKELLPINEIKKIIPGLEYARKKTLAAGMLYSINPLTTLGHGEYGHELKLIHPEMDFMVDFTGKKSRACACPLSPYWRKLMTSTYRLYAETKPARLWIEDDFRYNNHGSVKFGCYCDLHLREFAKRTGKTFSRDELVARLLRPGKPDPVRKEWQKFLGDVLAETVALIAKEAHAASPSTELAWMSVTPLILDVCGADIRQMLSAFADGRRGAIRIPTTVYTEQGHRAMLFEDESLKKALPDLPASITRCTEIESCFHSLYTKSAAFTAAQIEWAGILNVPNQTLNIFDYIGSPMNLTPGYGKMLASRKNEFNSFAEVFAEAKSIQGVGIISAPSMSANVHTTEGKSFGEFSSRESGWANPLRAFGIPIAFGTGEDITAVTGQALRSLDRKAIESIFSRGVMLDAPALKVLHEMGYSELAGAGIGKEKIGPFKSVPLGPEEMTDPDFGGGKYHYSWTYALWPEIVLKPMKGAKVISRITDVDGKPLYPAFVLYENKFGGRVAVCPYNLGGSGLDPYANREPSCFYSEYRKQQIQGIVKWLGRGKIPLIVDAPGWVLPHRADATGRVMLAAMNLNSDPWESIGMKAPVPGKAGKILWADINGNWRVLARKNWSQAGGLVSMRLKTIVPPLRTVAAQIFF
jgi:hypothetical protein